MPLSVYDNDLLLGEFEAGPLRLTPPTLSASINHARAIATELGTRDGESSVAAYWALESRLRLWQQIVARIGLDNARTSTFIEIGSGMSLFVLAGRMLGFRIAGIEASSERYQASLRIAGALFTDNHVPPVLAQARSEALPIPDASVDVVVSFQTLEHVADLAATLGEIRRVLKPGGLFFAQAPNYLSFYEAHYGVFVPLGAGKAWVRRYLRLRGRPIGFLEHLQWLTPTMLEELICASGFTSATVTRVTTPPLEDGMIHVRLNPLPFHFRRGRVATYIAYGIARAAELIGHTQALYPQLEIWAVA